MISNCSGVRSGQKACHHRRPSTGGTCHEAPSSGLMGHQVRSNEKECSSKKHSAHPVVFILNAISSAMGTALDSCREPLPARRWGLRGVTTSHDRILDCSKDSLP